MLICLTSLPHFLSSDHFSLFVLCYPGKGMLEVGSTNLKIIDKILFKFLE